MKTRVRQLTNNKWVVEARMWYSLGWQGARVYYVHVTTGGAVASGGSYVPVLSLERKSSSSYPLCWHDSADKAKTEEELLLAICGEGA